MNNCHLQDALDMENNVNDRFWKYFDVHDVKLIFNTGIEVLHSS